MARLRSLALTAWIILAAFLCSPQRASAVGFQPVSPDELKMTSEPKAPGAPAIILFRQLDRDDNGNTSHEDNYFRVKILNEQGRKHADIEIPFVKATQEVINIHARTIRPDGTIVNFDGKTFEKTIVKGKGIKYLAKTFTMPDVQVGGIIEYYYTVDYIEHLIFDSHWVVSYELFTKQARFSLKPYSRFKLTWIWQGTGGVVPTEGADRIIRMDVNDIPAFETEDFMPPANELKAHVKFIYTDSNVLETDNARYWKSAGKRMNDRAESFAKKRSGLEQVVAQTVSPNDSPEEKAQKLYARVQQIRNTSFAVQKSEEVKKRDKEKEINNAEDVLKGGFGNGYQLTWLYLGLARAAGLEAYGVLVSDRANYFFNPAIRDESRLNANVVLLHFKDHDVYCDPGAAFIPYGLLPWSEAGARGLKLDKDGGQWIETSLPNSQVSRITRQATLKLLPESGSLEGHLVVTYTGLEASTRRVEERNQDDTAHKKYLEDEVREFIPSGIEVELVNQPDWHSSSASFVAEFDLKVPAWVASAGRRAMMPVGLFGATEKHVFDHAQRTHPVYYRYPSSKADDITIQLPDGWRVSSLPPDTKEGQPIINFTSKVEDNKGMLHIVRNFNNDIVMMQTSTYSALQGFYRMMRTTDEQQIVLLPGTASASN